MAWKHLQEFSAPGHPQADLRTWRTSSPAQCRGRQRLHDESWQYPTRSLTRQGGQSQLKWTFVSSIFLHELGGCQVAHHTFLTALSYTVSAVIWKMSLSQQTTKSVDWFRLLNSIFRRSLFTAEWTGVGRLDRVLIDLEVTWGNGGQRGYLLTAASNVAM